MATIEICLNCESDFRQYFDTQLECKACRVDESPFEDVVYLPVEDW